MKENLETNALQLNIINQQPNLKLGVVLEKKKIENISELSYAKNNDIFNP